MKEIVSVLLVSAALSAPAFAGSDNFAVDPVGSKYAAVDLGIINYGSNSATSIGIGAGYQFHPYVAGEIDYIFGGTYSTSVLGSSIDTSASSLQFLAVGNMALTNELTAFAKAGLAHNSVKVTNNFNPLATGTASSNDLTFGIGIKYKVAKDISIRAQYQDYGTASMSVISVGAMFAF